MASLTGQSLGILKSWYTVKDFGSGSQTVNQSEALATKFLEDMYFPLTFQPVEQRTQGCRVEEAMTEVVQEENRPVVEKSDVCVVPRECFPETDFQSSCQRQRSTKDEEDQNVSGEFAKRKQNAEKTVSRNTTKQAGIEGGRVLSYWRRLAVVLWYILL